LTDNCLPESDQTKELLRLFGGLPLAIAQAAAFIRETYSAVSEYFEYYKKEWNDLISDSFRCYYNGSIQITWMISYEVIKKDDEIAANLIQLWAYLDNKDMWFGLFSEVLRQSSSLWPYLLPWFQDMASSKLKFTKAIQALLAFSMIELRQDLSAYSVHPVVHEWAL
jgi:hypothetical protein